MATRETEAVEHNCSECELAAELAEARHEADQAQALLTQLLEAVEAAKHFCDGMAADCAEASREEGDMQDQLANAYNNVYDFICARLPQSTESGEGR